MSVPVYCVIMQPSGFAPKVIASRRDPAPERSRRLRLFTDEPPVRKMPAQNPLQRWIDLSA